MVEIGRSAARLVRRHYMLLIPLAGVVVAVLAAVFSEITDESVFVILFSGSRALNPVVDDAATLSVATLAWMLPFKAAAWGISMGSFRGGPVFPAIFPGTAAGVLASHLPGFPEGAAVPTAVAATVVAVLRLPLAAAVVTLLLTSSAGLESSPLIIVGVVIAYIIAEKLTAWRGDEPDAEGEGTDEASPAAGAG